jgi:2-iminoacetate synthase
MNSFKNILDLYSWDEVKASIYSKTSQDVENALSSRKRTLEDFKALISPAAQPYLEQMAQLSHQLTQKRFGKTIQMYAPMYVSNECYNSCIYCGFNFENKIKRKTLNEQEILIEAEAIKKLGFNHILLVSGEANRIVHVDYFKRVIELIKPHFANISIEVQPLDTDEYIVMHDAGVYSVLVYQETYHREVYKSYHPRGKKTIFNYRLETPDRVGVAHRFVFLCFTFGLPSKGILADKIVGFVSTDATCRRDYRAQSDSYRQRSCTAYLCVSYF